MAEQFDWEQNLQNQVRLIQQEIAENGQITLDFIQNNEQLVYNVATNTSSTTPTLVFEALAQRSLELDGKVIEYYDLILFKALCKSQNPNIDQKVVKILCFEVRKYNWLIESLIKSYEIENHTLGKEVKKDVPNGLSKCQLPKLITVVESLFSTSNQFAKWKDIAGDHKFLQFLSDDYLERLEQKITKLKVEELLIVLAKNSAIHTPDIVSRLIELSKVFKGISRFLFNTGNNSVSLKYDTKLSVIDKQTEFMLATNYNLGQFEGSQSWAFFLIGKSKITSQVFGEAEYSIEIAFGRQEIFNLADTFKNLLEALKFCRQQPENNIPANTSVTLLALREKLNGVSFEDLIDINKETSVLRVLIDIARQIENLNWFQKTVTYKGLIQEFEEFIRTLRFDLIKNSGIEGRAYQLEYVKKSIPAVEENNLDEITNEVIYKDKVILDYTPGYYTEKKIIQSHIQEGQNPKELVDGLIQIQGILKQLQARITKIPIVELTPEQIQDKLFLDEGYQEIESLFQVFPDLTDEELFIKLCPGEEVPDKVEEFEWLLGYIEKERLLQMDKDIAVVAEANLAEYKTLSKVLNSIFAPDQSVEFTLIEGNYPENLKQLWKKVQNIQAVYNGLKSDKNGLDQSEKRYSIFYKKFSRILLEELIKVYQEIAYGSPNEKLGKIANDKVQVIGQHLNMKNQDSLTVLDSESNLE